AQIVTLPPPASGQVDFARDIQPIFRSRCHVCHGPQQQMNGLRLDDPAAAARGGYSGPVINPGHSADSKLVQLVAGAGKIVMPPAGPRLPAEEIGLLRAWIDQGAKWPASAAAPAQGSLPAEAAHWAFRPIQRREPPAVRHRSWVRNPIDNFILARLEAEGIEPSA